MKVLNAMKFTLQILMLSLLFELASSNENIYVDTSIPDHAFPVMRRGKSALPHIYCIFAGRCL
jgi:hypothetical protein